MVSILGPKVRIYTRHCYIYTDLYWLVLTYHMLEIVKILVEILEIARECQPPKPIQRYLGVSLVKKRAKSISSHRGLTVLRTRKRLYFAKVWRAPLRFYMIFFSTPRFATGELLARRGGLQLDKRRALIGEPIGCGNALHIPGDSAPGKWASGELGEGEPRVISAWVRSRSG